MKVLTGKVIREHQERFPECSEQLKSWRKNFEKTDYENFNQVKEIYNSVRMIDNKITFKIKGNKYRLIARVNFEHKAIRVVFFDTHAEYDKIEIKDL